MGKAVEKCSNIGGQKRRRVGRWALGVGRYALGVGRDALSVTCWALGVTRWALHVICQSAGKKSAWTDLDQVNFEKNLQCLNVQTEKSAWTGLDKVKKGLFSGECLSNFFTTGHGFDFDKRCSGCYTRRGCGLADVQSGEELKMLLQAKRQPG